jgi:soluble lytic murein transglycosylase-like protein
MARLGAVPLLSVLALPLTAASSSGMRSFVDADGVMHVTNVAPDTSAPIQSAARPAFEIARTADGTAAYDEHICAAAERHGVAPALIKAVMAVESNFDPAAVSVKGAAGLMQLMPGTARDLDVADVLDPGQNIGGAARYLRHLHERFDGDLEKVLAAYNAGPEAVRRAGNALPAYKETRAYVRRVLAARDVYARADWCGRGVGPGALTMR